MRRCLPGLSVGLAAMCGIANRYGCWDYDVPSARANRGSLLILVWVTSPEILTKNRPGLFGLRCRSKVAAWAVIFWSCS
jgi:hypothetical protein